MYRLVERPQIGAKFSKKNQLLKDFFIPSDFKCFV